MTIVLLCSSMMAVVVLVCVLIRRRRASRLEREWIAFRDAPRPAPGPARIIAPGIIERDDEILIVMNPTYGQENPDGRDDD